MPYTVNFNKSVTFTDHTGVSFVKNRGLAGEETLAATSATVSPAQTIVYNVPAWTVAVIAGDTIELDISAISNYVDPDGVAIEAQTLLLTNCLDVVATNLTESLSGLTLTESGTGLPLTES